MNQLLEKARERVKQILEGFTPGQKAVTGIAVLVVLVGGYLFTSWAAKPTYAPLFTGLSGPDAQAVTDALVAQGTPHKLANGGTTILVPNKDVYSARIALSADGLPSGGTVGWGILDDQGITASEFRQRVDFQRALEGELVKTISSIDGVESVSVHLVIPKEDLFTEDQQKASASVLLGLKPGTTMSASRVQSVVHLVSSSVEGLAPDSVAISDTAGNLLSAPGEEGADLAAGDFRAQQTAAYERRTKQKIEQQLQRLVGPGGVDVTVAAELNFDDASTTSEEFDGTDAPVVRETTNEETFTGNSPGTGGALGPEEAPIETDATNQDYTKTQADRTRAVDKTTRVTKEAPGKIVRQSISVLVDREATTATLDTIEQAVTAAAGIVEARGDTLSVAAEEFNTALEDAEAQARADAAETRRMDSLMDGLKTVATLLFVGLGLLFGYRRLRTPLTEESIPLEQLALQAGDGELLELDEEDIVELEPARPRDLVTYEGDDEASTVLVSRRHRRELDRLPGIEERLAENADIADLIDRQPDDVAQLLRGWMAERR